MELHYIFIFFLSFTILATIIFLAKYNSGFSHLKDLHGVQKFHENLTPRVGGIAIFVSFFAGFFLVNGESNLLLKLLIASVPVFIIGLYEDFTLEVSPMARLVSAFVSIFIAFVWVDIGVNSLGFEWADYLLSNYSIIALLFSLLVIGGAINAFNIIDGFNGLLGGYSILASLAMTYVSYILDDTLMFHLSLVLAISLLGFFVFNFPFGKIFMGDGGAYFVGFMLSMIGLMLVGSHSKLSSWFVLLIFIYPMYELLYSIYRRRVVYKTDASQPDALHLHSLVYRKLISCNYFKHNKVLCNSMTSPLMWLLSLLGIVPAVVWHENQTILIIFVFIFMIVYTAVYKYISSKKVSFNR